ncbi:MAG TPA: hypothetical protein VG796_07560 [Verrucomicrobiales bacterium]|nr:hypothetical protein [Verrucomicrobiales bacterium]
MNILTERDVLERVVKVKGLDTRWKISLGAAIAKLRESAEASLKEGTDIVALTVWDSDPALGAELANAVRVAYEQRRQELEDERVRRLVTNTDLKIQEQRTKVEDARLSMVETMKKNNIVDTQPLSAEGANPETEGDTGKSAAERLKLRQQASEYSAAKYAYESQMMLLNTMREYKVRMEVDLGANQKPVEILEEAMPPGQ